MTKKIIGVKKKPGPKAGEKDKTAYVYVVGYISKRRGAYRKLIFLDSKNAELVRTALLDWGGLNVRLIAKERFKAWEHSSTYVNAKWMDAPEPRPGHSIYDSMKNVRCLIPQKKKEENEEGEENA